MKIIREVYTLLTLIAINFLMESAALSQTKLVTIASILDNSFQGQQVILRGKIIGHQQGEPDYIFTDGTNQITVQLQEENFSYDPDTILEISGIIDFESQNLEELEQDKTPEDIQIKVNQLQVINSQE